MNDWLKKHYPLVVTGGLVIGLFLWWFPKVWTADSTLVAQLTARDFYKTIGKAAALLGILQFGLSTWVKVRIEESVKYGYARKLEDYRNEIKIREQAARVASFLAYAKWHQSQLDGEDFDKTAWELSLWLPPEVCRELKKSLVGERTDETMKQVLLAARKVLLGDKAGDLSANDILYFVKTKKTL